MMQIEKELWGADTRARGTAGRPDGMTWVWFCGAPEVEGHETKGAEAIVICPWMPQPDGRATILHRISEANPTEACPAHLPVLGTWLQRRKAPPGQAPGEWKRRFRLGAVQAPPGDDVEGIDWKPNHYLTEQAAANAVRALPRRQA